MISLATSTLPVAWLVARAAGLVALVLLTAAVTMGLLLSTRILGNKRGKMLLEWHQAVIWSSVSMLVLHASGLLLDPTIKFGFAAVLVPGAAPWRPLPVAAGIVAGWLILTLAVSFRFRRRIGQRRWRLCTTPRSSPSPQVSGTRSTSDPTWWAREGSRSPQWPSLLCCG